MIAAGSFYEALPHVSVAQSHRRHSHRVLLQFAVQMQGLLQVCGRIRLDKRRHSSCMRGNRPLVPAPGQYN